MRKFYHFYILVLVNTLGMYAQNLDLYALRGNPYSLLQNPGAKTELRRHLSLPGLTTQGNLTSPLGQVWGDLGPLLRNLEAPNVGLSTAVDLEVLGVGWQRKKTYTWFQVGVDLDAKIHLDKDVLLFGIYGMKDANGTIDPNFQADFSQSDLGVSANGRFTLGKQITLKDKLTLGIAIQGNKFLGGFDWKVNEWSLMSIEDPQTQMNSILYSSDMHLSVYGLISDAATLDSAIDFPRYLVTAMVPGYLDLIKAQRTTYTLSAGLSYRPIKFLTFSASISGLPLYKSSPVKMLNSRSLSWTSSVFYDGFTAGFSPQDTSTLSYYLSNLENQALGDFSIQSAPAAIFNSPFSLHAAIYAHLSKQHTIGGHLAHTDRFSGLHQSLGVEYQGFYGRNLQVAAAYRLHRWNGIDGSPEVSSLIQHRVFPWTTVFYGLNLWLSTPGFEAGNLLYPANFQSWQVTMGVNFTLYDKRFKEERKEKREAKKAKKKAQMASPLFEELKN